MYIASAIIYLLMFVPIGAAQNIVRSAAPVCDTRDATCTEAKTYVGP